MEHEKASAQFRFLILLLLSIKVDWAEASQSNCESLLQFSLSIKVNQKNRESYRPVNAVKREKASAQSRFLSCFDFNEKFTWLNRITTVNHSYILVTDSFSESQEEEEEGRTKVGESYRPVNAVMREKASA